MSDDGLLLTDFARRFYTTHGSFAGWSLARAESHLQVETLVMIDGRLSFSRAGARGRGQGVRVGGNTHNTKL